MLTAVVITMQFVPDHVAPPENFISHGSESAAAGSRVSLVHACNVYVYMYALDFVFGCVHACISLLVFFGVFLRMTFTSHN